MNGFSEYFKFKVSLIQIEIEGACELRPDLFAIVFAYYFLFSEFG